MIIGQFCKVTVPLSAVKSFRDTADKRVQVTYLDGDTEMFGESEISSTLRNTVQASFPAEGVKWLVTLHDDKMKPCDVEARSVLGFMVDATGELRAVTLDGNLGDPALLFPDGHVEAFEVTWPSLDMYRAYVIEQGLEQQLVGHND